MLLIKHGTLYTMEGNFIPFQGDLLSANGKIIKIAETIEDESITIPPDDSLTILDASGCLVFPGFIDAHSHIGITEAKMAQEGDDSNELSDPITPQLRALDGVNPMDAAFDDAVRAGITSVMVGPGSANVVGGQFLFMKTKGRVIDKLCVKEPAAMKISFGENPKNNYGSEKKMPSTRMAIAAMLRSELYRAKQYSKNHSYFINNNTEETEAQNKTEMIEKDFSMECWLPVLLRKIPLKAHVHRADDILTAIRIAKEFQLDLTLDHCTEGHLIAEEIAESGFPAIVGPHLTSRNKIEIKNLAFKTAGILANAGVKIAITTDHPVTLIQSLPICAGLAVKSGLEKREALCAITINPAEICKVSDRVGSLTPGKDADIVIFNSDPLELASLCLYTIINGTIVFDYEKDNS